MWHSVVRAWRSFLLLSFLFQLFSEYLEGVSSIFLYALISPVLLSGLTKILNNNSVFITVIISKINLILIKMDPKEILLKEISEKVGDKINERIISEKVNQFFKHGNVFLLFEVINLRKEIERLKEELQHQRNNERRKSLHALSVQ